MQWMQEPLTLRAFHSLLHLHRLVGVAGPETLPALLAESSQDQQEVTDQLGYQVRQAVEVLTQAFDRIDAESGRTLLNGVGEKALYDSALTVMMRLVFLFSAEERGLLLLGDPLYDQNYALSTLSAQLREQADQHGEEVLERRHDAWCRLLSTFRAVHGGVEHEAMRLPAYGGTLFDPDRYPFLEGRAGNTSWRSGSGTPLLVNNRVVLHLLEALQLLRVRVPGGGSAEARRLSFRALDIEQIGHVYEGLLDHTAKRAVEPVLGLAGSKDKEPEIPLRTLEDLSQKGTAPLVEFVRDETGRSERALKRLIEEPPPSDDHALLIACGQDERLAYRVKPYAPLLRKDSFGHLVVFPPGSVYVTSGNDRRSTGTHYTPRSLTEPIVRQTLDPLVYLGPADGLPEAEWTLRTPKDILGLKVCDMAMGSGAFLVEACRYLAERLVEAWENTEREHPGSFVVTPDGTLSAGRHTERLLPMDSAERVAMARRYVADRCLYGVDINPMAVEMAKLSLWLITLQRDKPFTFLDHALKCGDSLLGIRSVTQLENFSLRLGARQITFATANLTARIAEASAKRLALEDLPSNDYSQIESKYRLHSEAQSEIATINGLADALIAFELEAVDGDDYEQQRVVAAAEAERRLQTSLHALRSSSKAAMRDRALFHWPVEFPEVFAHGGFDAFVGNPPFMGGQLITAALGKKYRHYLVSIVALGQTGSADLCSYFFLRAVSLLRDAGEAGLLATNTIAEGETRQVGLEQLLVHGTSIRAAIAAKQWPGTAALVVSILWLHRGVWNGQKLLDGGPVIAISSGLSAETSHKAGPYQLALNKKRAFKGSSLQGLGFLLPPAEAMKIIADDSKYARVLFPLLGGSDVTSTPDSLPTRWTINFFDWSLEEAEKFPICLDIVRERVKPERDKVADRNSIGRRRAQFWWRYDAQARDLYAAIRNLPHVWLIPETSKYATVVKQSSLITYNHKVVVFATASCAAFAVLSSVAHLVWMWRFGGSLETRLSYSIAGVFETFPLPEHAWSDEGASKTKSNAEVLSAAGSELFEARREAMSGAGQGSTDFYNRFHNQGEQSPEILKLRQLQVNVDRAVMDAYGWRDIELDHGFHPTKQGALFTISEVARETLLERLLALNHQRHADELRTGLRKRGQTSGARKAKGLDSDGSPLFG
jgi:hypothetical protein